MFSDMIIFSDIVAYDDYQLDFILCVIFSGDRDMYTFHLCLREALFTALVARVSPLLGS